MMKHLTRSRGAAAALLLTIVTPVVGAQETEPVRARPRDTVVLRVFGGPDVPMDSLRVLLRAWEREPYGSADWVTITRRVDSLFGQRSALVARKLAEGRYQMRTAPAFAPTGWLGFLTQGPSEQIFNRDGQHVIYFAYPTIISVDPNSPAERAGIAPGDVLVAYNGVDVVNHEFNLTQLLRPERKLSISVRRDGDNKDFSVTVARGPERIARRRQDLDAAVAPDLRRGPPDAPEPAPVAAASPAIALRFPVPMLPRMFVPAPDGMFGASLAAAGAELAKALNIKPGVLVIDAAEGLPAWRAGLRGGDVIVSVEGTPVRSVSEFRDRVMTHLQQHSVALEVVRNQKPRTVKLSWASP